jgi:type VI secretion system protein ImpE
VRDPGFHSRRPLAEQLLELKSAIRAEPANASLRVYHFQLLCVLGEWQKAVDQLQMSAQLDPAATSMARAYREAILCEGLRQEVFAGCKNPHILGEPTAWMSLLTDALKQSAAGRLEEAAQLRRQAFEMAPPSHGEIDGSPFEWIADADNRLGPICEFFANGCYYWLPFESIRRVAFEKPTDLRDLVWQGCEVTLTNGGNLMGFIPSRYPLQSDDADDIKLARLTQWVELSDEHFAGRGQRLWATNSNEYALLDVRHLTLNCA